MQGSKNRPASPFGTIPSETSAASGMSPPEGGVDSDRVWTTCSCGAVLVRVVAFG